MEEPPEPGPFGPPEARFRLASAWTGWDLTGSQAIHPVPLPCSKTPAESMVPHQSQQFSFWWTGVRPKDHTGLEKDWAASFGRLGLIQGRDGGARQPAERRAALL